jgi:hypothetical protein
MKHKLLALILATSSLIIGCENMSSISPKQLDENIQEVPSGTVFGTTSDETLPSPKRYGEGVIKLAKFTSQEEVYNDSGSKILIPIGAVVTGLYENDGSRCRIKWKAIYANEGAYEDEKPSFEISDKVRDSICRSAYGIKQDSKVTIKFE